LQPILKEGLAIRITLDLMDREARFIGKVKIALIVRPPIFRPRIPGELGDLSVRRVPPIDVILTDHADPIASQERLSILVLPNS